MDADELVVVYETNDANEAELMRIALNNEGVSCMIDGENQAGLSGILSIKVMAKAWDADKARKIVSENDKNFHHGD